MKDKKILFKNIFSTLIVLLVYIASLFINLYFMKRNVELFAMVCIITLALIGAFLTTMLIAMIMQLNKMDNNK